MKDLKHLSHSINSYPTDIRAEVLLADMIQEGLSQSDFLVFFDSLFKRGYSRDILKAEGIVLNDYFDVLAVHLARDGLYDLLPEGLFHAPPESAMTSGGQMALDSRKEYQIEGDARKLFLPLENEFFYQRVQLELQERTILQKLNDNRFDDFFLRFWKIDQTLPHELIAKLSIMLPFIKKIVGDFQLTANCLGAILEEEVRYTIQHTSRSQTEIDDKHREDEFSLGEASLGVNLITGRNFLDCSKRIKFDIGPLKETGIESFLENGESTRFIECFCSFFIPLEMDYEFEVKMQGDIQGFVLGVDENHPVMGYSTTI